MGLTVSGIINLSFSLLPFHPSLFLSSLLLGPSVSASLLGKLQVLWAEELESRVGETGEALGVSGGTWAGHRWLSLLLVT